MRMKLPRGSAVAVVAALSALAPRASSQEVTPETVAAGYLAAMQAADWAGMAKLMHPDALRQLREYLSPLFASAVPEADAFRQQFLSVRTAAEAAALSDTTVFANFVRALNARDPAAARAISEAMIQQIGHVPDGVDIAHVVYRATLDVDGMTISNVNVLTVKRWERGWRVLLTGDYSALATALRRALGG